MNHFHLCPPSPNALLQEKFLAVLPTTLDGFRYKNPIPIEHKKAYASAMAKYCSRYFFLADEFHRRHPSPHFSLTKILDFLKETVGISTTLCAFEPEYGLNGNVSGRWEWDDRKKKESCTIFVNNNHPEERQRFTVAHEIVHPIQDIDFEFQKILSELPEPIRLKFIERIADKTAARFLAPDWMVKTYRAENRNNAELAKLFRVSEQVIAYT